MPTGSWVVVQPAAEDPELRAAAVSEGQGLAAAGKSVTVQANVTVIVIIIIIIVEPTNGDLLIRKEDEHGNLLAGACFTLTPLEGGDPIELCDGDEDDGSGAGGLIRFNNIRQVPMNFPNRRRRATRRRRTTKSRSRPVRRSRSRFRTSRWKRLANWS